ncbi:MAG TPA: MerR family DNA-binding transcriptional regulator [Pseudonocardia sp.]|nr:MerR family DNA-binding transcriptional regulator [Pseudonocardia sp.]
MSAPGWLLIAEFARRCRLPVSTLRYYDRVGLLRPAEVDPASGYRRYAVDQLPTAVIIAGLRAIGTAPDVIARILAGGPGAVAALADERTRITDEITRRADALRRLDKLCRLSAPCGPEELCGAGGLAGGRRPTPVRPCHVELAASEVPALAFDAGADELAAAITRCVASLRARLRGREVHVLGWGAVLPLDLGEHVAGHVFARTEPARAEGVPGPVPSGVEMLALPPGCGVRVDHDGDHDELAHAYHAALIEVDRLGARPAGRVLEDYGPLTGRRDAPAVRITVPLQPWS